MLRLEALHFSILPSVGLFIDGLNTNARARSTPLQYILLICSCEQNGSQLIICFEKYGSADKYMMSSAHHPINDDQKLFSVCFSDLICPAESGISLFCPLKAKSSVSDDFAQIE